MPNRYELTDKTFGRLTVISFDHVSDTGDSYWLCECSCQDRTRVVVRGRDLVRGSTRSCGCLRKDANDITGRTFSRLTVLGLDHITDKKRTYWLCECCCGNRVIVRRDGLINGAVKSCGCYHSEELTTRLTKHGMSTSRLYKIWSGMRQRCENTNDPRYRDYGGRGTTICEEWGNFENFYDWALNHGYSDDLSIDREDNDQGYSPDNCRWADEVTQQNNTRRNHHFSYGGETKTIAEWTRCLGVKYSTLWHRIYRGDFSDFERYFYDKEYGNV